MVSAWAGWAAAPPAAARAEAAATERADASADAAETDTPGPVVAAAEAFAESADAFACDVDPEPSDSPVGVPVDADPAIGAVPEERPDAPAELVALAAYARAANEGPARRMTRGMIRAVSAAGAAPEGGTAAAPAAASS